MKNEALGGTASTLKKMGIKFHMKFFTEHNLNYHNPNYGNKILGDYKSKYLVIIFGDYIISKYLVNPQFASFEDLKTTYTTFTNVKK